MPGYQVDTEALVEAALNILIAIEQDMPRAQEQLTNAVGQVQDMAPVSTGSFGERWGDELGILNEILLGFVETLGSCAGIYAQTDVTWATMLECEG